MLDDYIKRDDIKKFIKELINNHRYYEKSFNSESVYSRYILNEMALYTFYDALIKYKIVLDDIYLFDEFLEQLEKIYNKLNNYDDIEIGINKLIGKMVAIKLGFKDVNDSINKKQLISYIFNKYILEGYYIHGFSTIYYDDIKVKGLIPNDYKNYYNNLKEVNKIFNKYGYNLIDKDFDNDKIYYTDDVIMACFYSICSPGYFHDLLFNHELFGDKVRRNGYLANDFDRSTRYIKIFMNDKRFSDLDKKCVLSIIKNEWDLIHKKKRKVDLLFVKRKRLFNNNKIDISNFLYDERDTYEIVDRLLSPKNGNVISSEKLNREDIKLVQLNDYYEIDENTREITLALDAELLKLEEEQEDEFDNTGAASLFIVLGALFITLGVIISIVLILSEL